MSSLLNLPREVLHYLIRAMKHVYDTQKRKVCLVFMEDTRCVCSAPVGNYSRSLAS